MLFLAETSHTHTLSSLNNYLLSSCELLWESSLWETFILGSSVSVLQVRVYTYFLWTSNWWLGPRYARHTSLCSISLVWGLADALIYRNSRPDGFLLQAKNTDLCNSLVSLPTSKSTTDFQGVRGWLQFYSLPTPGMKVYLTQKRLEEC